MKTSLLILLLTLGGARKEATKRWPAADQYKLKIDQTVTKYKYELYVWIAAPGSRLMGPKNECIYTLKIFKGKDWQEVLDLSKNDKSTCTNPVNPYPVNY